MPDYGQEMAAPLTYNRRGAGGTDVGGTWSARAGEAALAYLDAPQTPLHLVASRSSIRASDAAGPGDASNASTLAIRCWSPPNG